MALIKCSECGREISDKAVSCPGCGCPVEVATGDKISPVLEKVTDGIEICNNSISEIENREFVQKGYTDKQKRMTLILCILLGFFGVHRFYLKRISSAILMLSLAVIQIVSMAPIINIVWVIIDLVHIANGDFFDNYDRKKFVKQKKMEISEIADKKYLINPHEYDGIVDDIYRNTENAKAATKILIQNTGLSYKCADDIVCKKYNGLNRAEYNSKIRSENKERQRQNSENLRNSLQTLSNLSSGSKVAKCPKCHSTSISYTNKKLSLGRTVVGGAVAGAPGAVIGGLTSKKGYGVCLNCGKRWKI